MEKPRKKKWISVEDEEIEQERSDYCRGYNSGLDAMSTWLEGEVKCLIEELKRVDHHSVAEEIWRVQELLRKLTGKV